MALKVPAPSSTWSPAYQIRVNQSLEAEAIGNRRKGADIELAAEKLIMRSPNGARWQIAVSNTGVVTAVAL